MSSISQPSILDLFPNNTPVYMTDAWLSCMHWAIGNKDILSKFREETGNKWTPASSPIYRAIDSSCGADWDFIKTFILWANDAVWGDPNEVPPE